MDIKVLNPRIKKIYKDITGSEAISVTRLPITGSNRFYFRVEGKGNSLIATYNEDRVENRAFLYLADHLKKHGVPVPEIFYSDIKKGIYFQEDLGDTCLFDIAVDSELSEENIFNAYKKVIDYMPLLQYKSAQDMDFTVCYPRASFDKQSIQWDLYYFKYLFLKLIQLPFLEQNLEDEFNKLTGFLLKAPSGFFLYRDFKSKNIMWKDDSPYFIDFQGGRRGALQYDLASLLFESKADLSLKLRNKLLDYYIEVFNKYDFFNKKEFLEYYPAFVLIRLLQVFGAYGYRGLFEKKVHFIHSIYPGIENLQWARRQPLIKHEYPYLSEIFDKLDEIKTKYKLPETTKGLTVSITSFSYRNGIPDDWSGNGGGFVFDCRALHNPGRYENYKLLTGMDREVEEFLKNESEAEDFIQKVLDIVNTSIRKYQSRSFNHLAVNFGCTGGRHRSVYCAERLYQYLKLNFDVNLRLLHRELDIEK